MNVLPNRIYHLKISTNFDYEALVLVTQVWSQIGQGSIPPKETDPPINDNSATINFRLLASTINIGEWSVMNVPLFSYSFPVEIAPKDLPLFLIWPIRTPAFEEVLKGV